MGLFILLHVLSVVLWVGGMFFAYMVLRTSIGQLLKLPDRLRLWDRVFTRFFKWVWLAIFLLLATGFHMIYLYGGMAVMPRYIHLMTLSAIVMMVIFVYLFFGCYVQFSQMVEEKEWHLAEAKLVTIRQLVLLNLILGLTTIVIAIMGRGF